MAQIPYDPLNASPNIYDYEQTDGGDGFLLTTYLENSGDEDAAKSQMRCDPTVTSLTDADIVAQRYLVCED
jgi:hypothetical protein